MSPAGIVLLIVWFAFCAANCIFAQPAYRPLVITLNFAITILFGLITREATKDE